MKWYLFILLFFIVSNSFNQTINDFYEEGVKLKEAGKIPDAIQKFTDVVSKDKYYHEAWFQRAQCYLIQNKTDLALLDLNNAITANKKYLDAYVLRSDIYIKQNKYDEALKDIQQVLILDPKNIKAYENRALIYLSKPDKKSMALNDLEKAVELSTQNVDTYIKLAELYNEKNKFDEAIKMLTAAINRKNDGNLYYERAKVYEKKKDLQNQYKDLSKAIELGIKNENIFSQRAFVAFEIKQYESVLNDATILIQQYHTKNYQIYVLRGKTYAELNKGQEAIKDFTKAITLKNNDAEAYYLRAMEYSKMGKTKEPLAIKDFNKAIELNPGNAEAYLYRGIYFFNKQKYDEAMNDLNKSIKLNATAEAYFYRGAVLYEKGKYNEACIDLNKSAQMNYLPAQKRVKEVCPQ